jgi:MarR family transcriptional regulator, organic hydroperoxide resistance regulator
MLSKPVPKSASATAPAPAALVPDDLICFALYSSGHAFNRVYKPLLEPLKLTYPQYLVMVALWAKDRQTVGSLCETLFLESNTLTPLLKRLEASGYVTRERNPDDERQVCVGLTRTGAALKAKTRDFPACIGAASGLTLESAQQLHAGILALRKALHKAARNAAA